MKRLDFALRISPLALSALCAFALPASAQTTDSSNTALGIDTHFESGGMRTHLGPVGAVAHNNNGAYDKSVQVSKVTENAAIIAQSPPPTIFINGSNISSEVKNSGIGVDSETSEATSSVGHASLMLNLNPPPPSANVVEPQPYLQVTGANFTADANFSTVFPSYTSATGTSSVKNLKIFGSLVGTSTLTYSGSAAPNTVIYDSPTVTITLNKQITAQVITCTEPGGCTTKVYSIMVAALDISLNKAMIDGHKVTGDIVVAQAEAQ
jgi:hypothetical protein